MTLTQLTSNHFQRIDYRVGETPTRIGLIATQAVGYCSIGGMPADKVHSFDQLMLGRLPINERPLTFSGKRSAFAVTTARKLFARNTPAYFCYCTRPLNRGGQSLLSIALQRLPDRRPYCVS